MNKPNLSRRAGTLDVTAPEDRTVIAGSASSTQRRPKLRVFAPLSLALGELLSRLRKRSARSLQETADAIGMTVATLRAIEGGYNLLQTYHALPLVREFPELKWHPLVRVLTAAASLEQLEGAAEPVASPAGHSLVGDVLSANYESWLAALKLVDPTLARLITEVMPLVQRGNGAMSPKPLQEELVERGFVAALLDFLGTSDPSDADRSASTGEGLASQFDGVSSVLMQSIVAQANDSSLFPPSVAVEQLAHWERLHAAEFLRIYGVIGDTTLLRDLAYTWPFLEASKNAIDTNRFQGVFILIDASDSEIAAAAASAASKVRSAISMAKDVKRVASMKVKGNPPRVWIKSLKTLPPESEAELRRAMRMNPHSGKLDPRLDSDAAAQMTNGWSYVFKSSPVLVGFADDSALHSGVSAQRSVPRAISLSVREARDFTCLLERAWARELKTLSLKNLLSEKCE